MVVALPCVCAGFISAGGDASARRLSMTGAGVESEPGKGSRFVVRLPRA
ncbi:MAG: hypothetical protein HY321_16150 [Armatimonadetes bacterium]|nr:hypothetical protein [Armatimonadota bacterium]